MNQREWECILAGRLASNDEMEEAWHSSVFINNERSIQFSIKVMSDSPDIISDVEQFTCWANKLSEFTDDPIAERDERIESLRAYLAGKIILFKPVQRIDPETRSRYHMADPVAVLDAPASMSEYSRLVPILNLPDVEPEEFEKKLFSRHPVGGPYNRTFPKDMPIPDPVTVWVKDRLYGPFDGMRSVYGGWTFRGDHARKMKAELSEYKTLVLPYRNVVFIEADTYYQGFVRRLDTEGVALDEPLEAEPASAPSPPEEELDEVAATAVAEAPVEKEAATPGPEPRPVPESGDVPAEAAFLDRVKRLAQAKRLFYNEEDLVNFHTALKTGSLVLLSGMSGTGKSRLVQLYAEALGMDDDQFSMISVRPTWTDDSDLLGFLDLTHSIYRPADSGLIDLLLRAHHNPDKLFMVCFDEMNLARVEHYFSQFISVLELEANYRCIKLYSDSMEDRIYNSAPYPAKLPIGSNIMFVGTVNVDESTYAFSDKVLDRAHVIRLRVEPFSEIWTHYDQESGPVETPTVPFTAYDTWRTLPGDIKLSQGELEFLQGLHTAFQGFDLQRGMGHRTVRQIDRYLRNIPVDEDGGLSIERSVAFDLQVVQKVLTKLRGPREQLEHLVGRLDAAGEVEASSLVDLMDEFEDLSSFTISRQEIKQKAKELKAYGYAS